jgi:hypothetical protein
LGGEIIPARDEYHSTVLRSLEKDGWKITYAGIFNEDVGKLAIERLKLKLMVFNPTLEEIVEWIH